MSQTTEAVSYYFPTKGREANPHVYVAGVGHAIVAAGAAYPPAGHPEPYHFTWNSGRTLAEYQIVFITGGTGEFETSATGSLRVKPGSALLIFPGVWHRYRPALATGWTESWVSFGGMYINYLRSSGFIQPSRAMLSLPLNGSAANAFREMIQHVRLPGEQLTHQVVEQLFELLGGIEATAQDGASALPDKGMDIPTNDPIVTKAVRLIWSTSLRLTTVDGMIRQLPISRRSLERRFREKLGRSIHDEITRCRVERAKRILKNIDLSLEQAARAAGFSDARGMARGFQSVLGISAAAYQQQIKAESVRE
jgi:AraC-like DNA-binding protein